MKALFSAAQFPPLPTRLASRERSFGHALAKLCRGTQRTLASKLNPTPWAQVRYPRTTGYGCFDRSAAVSLLGPDFVSRTSGVRWRGDCQVGGGEGLDREDVVVIVDWGRGPRKPNVPGENVTFPSFEPTGAGAPTR